MTEYVRKRYKIPAPGPLEVSELGFVQGSCYRRLLFAAAEQRGFRIEIIASPDFRFLMRELMDVNTDPAEEERKRQQALLAKLAEGKVPTLGPREARVTLTVFSDFECPYCAQMAATLRHEVLPRAGDTVRLLFRNFPLAMHPWARTAAEAAACAQDQGDEYFWELHDYLFAQQRELKPANLREALLRQASDMAGFDRRTFEACLEQRKTVAKVDGDLRLGNQIGVRATPTLFINGEQIKVNRPEQILTLLKEIGRREASIGN